jgi:NADP-dependent 3-hydroxy acid dehydrogenase YdfG
MEPLVWLVTGCSSGFGEAFVQRILARGDKVIATARNLKKIEHLEESGAAVLQLDVTDTQKALNDKAAEAIEKYGRIDVLVNNAAFVTAGGWEDLE